MKRSFPPVFLLLLLAGMLVFTMLLGGKFRLERPTITLALTGDIMLGRGVAQAHRESAWETALNGIAPILYAADLALGNLESPLAETVPASVAQALAAGEYNLCAPGNAVHALTAAGLDVLALANNHSSDCGAGGLAATAGILADAGLTPLLPGAPVFLAVHDLRLALLAFDDVSAPLDLASAAAQVRAAHAEDALVIVSVHWGAEYQGGASRRQQQIARTLADAGAALIWGHHPHVLQTVEWLPQNAEVQRGGHDGPSFVKDTLTAYSLGNGLFDQVSPPDVRRSAILLVTLDANGVQAVRAIPIQIDPLNGTVGLAEPETAKSVLRRLQLEPPGQNRPH